MTSFSLGNDVPRVVARWCRSMEFVLLLVVTGTALLLPIHESNAEVAVPKLSAPVVDLTGALGSEREALNARLRGLRTEKGLEVAVLIVGSVRPETIEQFSIRVAEEWKLGRARIDDGVILIVALQDREVRIEVGRGLEGDLTDLRSRRIIDEQIVPHFKNGEIARGIVSGVEAIVAVASGAELPPPAVSRGENENGNAGMFLLLFGGFILGELFTAFFGRLLGATSAAMLGFTIVLVLGTFASALVAAAGIWLLVFFRDVWIHMLGSGTRGGGGYRGGWGGGPSGGHFGGGGGTFAGGGATGRW